MPEKDKSIFKNNHGEKSMKAPLLLILTQSLLEKIATCQ